MYDVHDDGDAHLVGGVDELLQFFGCAETAGGGEEIAHMIAEGAVVGMLGYGHHLNGVVAVFLDARQDVVLELGIGAHFLGILCHADVAFVDEERVGVGLEVLFLELIGLCWRPDLCGEYLCHFVLYHAVGVGRYALPFSALPLDFQFEEVAMVHLAGFQFDFPVAVVDAGHLVGFIFLPSVEVAHQMNVGGIRRPLAQHPSLGGFVKSEVQVSAGKVGKGLFATVGQFIQLV